MEVYPLVNIQKTMENHHAFFMGKLTISMAIFHSYVTNYQRVPNKKWCFSTSHHGLLQGNRLLVWIRRKPLRFPVRKLIFRRVMGVVKQTNISLNHGKSLYK
jgi:hypothetical protein